MPWINRIDFKINKYNYLLAVFFAQSDCKLVQIYKQKFREIGFFYKKKKQPLLTDFEYYYPDDKLFCPFSFITVKGYVETKRSIVLDYDVIIKSLSPEDIVLSYGSLGNYSLAGFEMILHRYVSHYIITYYLPSGRHIWYWYRYIVRYLKFFLHIFWILTLEYYGWKRSYFGTDWD